MLKLKLSRAAQQHLEDIWLYTISEWGEDQAEKYVALIEKALSLLADNPYVGKVRPDVKPGYRALQAGKHLIFYSVSIPSRKNSSMSSASCIFAWFPSAS